VVGVWDEDREKLIIQRWNNLECRVKVEDTSRCKEVQLTISGKHKRPFAFADRKMQESSIVAKRLAETAASQASGLY